MSYIVIEIQTNENGEIGQLVSIFPDRNNAEMKYHQILAAAAISEIPSHAAVMLTNDGRMVKHEVYYHSQPEPEPEPEDEPVE